MPVRVHKKQHSKYTVDYFIQKFSAIPRSQWCTDAFVTVEGTRCALGHCGNKNIFSWTPEALMLQRALGPVGHPVAINDGDSVKFRQKTPKGRILAALRMVKKLESRGA